MLVMGHILFLFIFNYNSGDDLITYKKSSLLLKQTDHIPLALLPYYLSSQPQAIGMKKVEK